MKRLQQALHVGLWLEQWRRIQPRKIALVDIAAERRYTYAELAQRVESLAFSLRCQYQVKAGDRIAVLSFNRAEIIELLFACARLNAILVPLNYRLTATELQYILNDAEPRLLFHDEVHAKTALHLGQMRMLQLVAFEGASTAYPTMAEARTVGELPAADPDPAAPLLILYTSGTTGHPKGALLSHRMITWNAINTTLSWDLTGHDSTLIYHPLFHTGGLHVLTTPLLYRGGTVAIMRHFDATKILETIEQERSSIIFAVPTMFQMMLQQTQFNDTDFSSVRFMISGGAPCPVPLILAYQRRGLVFKQGYGLTEIGPNCFTLHESDAVRKVGSIGMPNFYLQASVRHDDGTPVEQDEVGELWLRGPVLFEGYWRLPDASRDVFDSEGWLKTGDLVRVDRQGFYYVVDRKKDMYISGGENVYPAEVEQALLEHPAVAEVAVVGVPDERWGEVGRVFLVFRDGLGADQEALESHLRDRVAGYKMPVYWDVVSSLPRNSAGKVLKIELRGRALPKA